MLGGPGINPLGVDPGQVLVRGPRGRVMAAGAMGEPWEGSGYLPTSVERFDYFNIHLTWCTLTLYYI